MIKTMFRLIVILSLRELLPSVSSRVWRRDDGGSRVNAVPNSHPGASRQVRPGIQELPKPIRSVVNVIGRVTRFALLGVFGVLAVAFLALAVGLQTNTVRAVPVLSGSMSPAIDRGDIALVTPVKANKLQENSVVVFRPPTEKSSLIIHRVIKVERNEKTRIITKGDANGFVDPWEADLESQTAWQLQYRIPKVAAIGWTLNSPIGRTIFMGGVVPIFIVTMLSSIWRSGKQARIRMARRRRRPQTARRIVAGGMAISILFQADPAAALFTSKPTAPTGNTGTTTILAATPTVPACTWADSTHINLSWTANASTLLDGYDVSRSATSGGTFNSLGTVAGRTSTAGGPYTVTDPNDNYFRIQSTRNQWRSNAVPTGTPGELPSVSCTRTISTVAGPPSTGAGTTLSGTFRATLVNGATVYASDVENDVVWALNTTTGTMSAFAGNFSQSFSGDGGPATAAGLAQPYGLAFDATKANMYIADTTNARIRKVDMSTNIITTIAGSGTAGNTGDGAAATAARLNNPSGIAVDATGNVYIADYTNHKIRKIDSATQFISTFAGTGTAGFTGDGGAATAATLSSPVNVAIDGNGNLFVAEYGTSVIRKIDTGTNILTTVAGTGTAGYTNDGSAATTARVNRPYGIGFDTSNNIYIADATNNRIRKVTVATGIISTVVGSVAGFTGDGAAASASRVTTPYSVAFDGSNNYYIGDFGNRRLRRVDSTTGFISTVAGNGFLAYSGDGGQALNAQFDRPAQMVMDPSGNMYVSDTSNCVVRKISSTGIVSTVAGNGTCAYAGDGGPATAASLRGQTYIQLDPAGTGLYIADTTINRIRKVTFSTGFISTVAGTGLTPFTADGSGATATNLNAPRGIAIDAAGNIYVSETGNQRIRKFTDGGNVSTVAGTGTASSTGNGADATLATLNNPYDLAVNAAGTVLYVNEYSGHRVRKIDLAPGGFINAFAGSGTSGTTGDGAIATAARLNAPQGIGIDTQGNVYIADTGNNRVRVVSAASGYIYAIGGNATTGWLGDGGLATAARINSPIAILPVSSTGDVYIADNLSHRIRLLSR